MKLRLRWHWDWECQAPWEARKKNGPWTMHSILMKNRLFDEENNACHGLLFHYMTSFLYHIYCKKENVKGIWMLLLYKCRSDDTRAKKCASKWIAFKIANDQPLMDHEIERVGSQLQTSHCREVDSVTFMPYNSWTAAKVATNYAYNIGELYPLAKSRVRILWMEKIYDRKVIPLIWANSNSTSVNWGFQNQKNYAYNIRKRLGTYLSQAQNLEEFNKR